MSGGLVLSPDSKVVVTSVCLIWPLLRAGAGAGHYCGMSDEGLVMINDCPVQSVTLCPIVSGER